MANFTEFAEPTFKEHIFGLHPIVVSVANTGEVPAGKHPPVYPPMSGTPAR